MRSPKKRIIKARTVQSRTGGSAEAEVKDTPGFLVRLVGARQAKALAATTGAIRPRRD
jgi:hypothetical protein